MHPFLIFAIILIVIWTLSGLATWINKQQEAERRRRAAMEFSRNPIPPQVSYEPPQRISEGLAMRHPEVLQPPAPLPPRVVRQPVAASLPPPRIMRPPLPMPPRIPQQRVNPPKRAAAQRAQLTQRQLRQRHAQALAAAAQETEEDRPHIPIASAPQPAPAPQRPATAGPRADAPTLARWLRPSTLQQQFILTELFQPPLALRDPDRRI